MKTLKSFLKEKGVYRSFIKNLVADKDRNSVQTKADAKRYIENRAHDPNAICRAFWWEHTKYPLLWGKFKRWDKLDSEWKKIAREFHKRVLWRS